MTAGPRSCGSASNSTPPVSPTTAGSRLEIIGVGLVAGFLSGLFGVGGGILIVPSLVLILHMAQRLAHGTSLAAIVPIAVAGVIGFALEDAVDWAVAGLLIVGAAAGAVVGTRLLAILPARALGFIFTGALLATAIRLVFDQSDATGRGDLTVAGGLGLVAIGMLSGVLAGLLGVGGGIIMVPAMVLLYSIPGAVAKGTSLAVIIPTAVVGTVRNLHAHNADLQTAALVGLSGMVSSFAASKISIGLDDRLSNILFAGLLVLTSLRTLVTHLRRPADPPASLAD
ncbi:MAG: sulfite exporter TauE/SafE family protein [Acidimicrobiales bacterium]